MYHLAILRQPFLNMILDGTKTIESRFSYNKIIPFGKVEKGDVIYLKLSGGKVIAKAKVDNVQFYNLTPEIVEEIRVKYGRDIGTDRFEDWTSTTKKKYCTLMWLKDIEKISPITVAPSHGSAWFLLDKPLDEGNDYE